MQVLPDDAPVYKRVLIEGMDSDIHNAAKRRAKARGVHIQVIYAEALEDWLSRNPIKEAIHEQKRTA